MRALNARESDLLEGAEQEEIRSTIRQNWSDWLDSIDQQFGEIAHAFFQEPKYWRLSDASRLNFLAWDSQPELGNLLLSWATQDIKQKRQLGEFPSQGGDGADTSEG